MDSKKRDELQHTLEREVDAAKAEHLGKGLPARVEPNSPAPPPNPGGIVNAPPLNPEAGGGSADRNRPKGAPAGGAWVSGGVKR